MKIAIGKMRNMSLTETIKSPWGAVVDSFKNDTKKSGGKRKSKQMKSRSKKYKGKHSNNTRRYRK
jgi:hypothetical protein